MNLLRSRLLGLCVALPMAVASALAGAGPTIQLTVDATQAPLRIIRTQMTMTASPGPMTIYYPKWIPGMHGPDGPISSVTGLKFAAGGKTIPWRRDLEDGFIFHIEVPSGADRVEATFDFLEAAEGGSATDKLVVIEWNQNLLYPAGARAEDMTYNATLILPAGWKCGTALPVEHESGNRVVFKPISLDHLVDSPVVAGEHYRAVDITPPGEPIHHEMDIVADAEEDLEMSPEVQKKFTNLVTESRKLFGAFHYRDYHFLLTLSNHVAHFGLEHHESNDSRSAERALLSPAGVEGLGHLLPHEFVHSWNGKFRRPKDLSTPYYEQPERTDLLWVYEGLTEFLGPLLAARSGLWTLEQYRDHLAITAAEMGPARPGRTWRTLQDTADAEPYMGFGFGRGGWPNWKRGTDYYPEGDLLWLEVASIIHEKSDGKKSIEDFCHAFHGGPNNGPELKSYTLDELVEALNNVIKFDWAGFFHERLTSTSPEAPVGGIEAGGWKIEYNNKPVRGDGGGRFGGGSNTTYSLGLSLGGDGTVFDTIWNSPAFKAGIVPGMKVVAINGRAFTPELLGDALKASEKSMQKIEFLVVNDDYYSIHRVVYQGGAKYPHLMRVEGKPDWLDDLSKPLAK